MRQTRHKSTEVALGYLRPADLWRNNVREGLFALARKIGEAIPGNHQPGGQPGSTY